MHYLMKYFPLTHTLHYMNIERTHTQHTHINTYNILRSFLPFYGFFLSFHARSRFLSLPLSRAGLQTTKQRVFLPYLFYAHFFPASFLSPELSHPPQQRVYSLFVYVYILFVLLIFSCKILGMTMTLCDVKRVDFYFALLCLLSVATVCAVKRQNEENESEAKESEREKQSKFPRNETKTKEKEKAYFDILIQ